MHTYAITARYRMRHRPKKCPYEFAKFVEASYLEEAIEKFKKETHKTRNGWPMLKHNIHLVSVTEKD